MVWGTEKWAARIPTPFRGHDPRQQCAKKRSEVLQGPKVTSCKELWECTERGAPAWGDGPVLTDREGWRGKGRWWWEPVMVGGGWWEKHLPTDWSGAVSGLILFVSTQKEVDQRLFPGMHESKFWDIC